MNTKDQQLEYRISEAHLQLVDARNRHEREEAAKQLASLVKQRSAKRVREMEKERFGRSI